MDSELNEDVSVSKGWVYFSLLLFIVIEVCLAHGFAYYFKRGAMYGHVTELKLEVILILMTYIVGGFAIGFFSPSVRIYEPAIAAFASVMLAFMLGYFSPYGWFHVGLNRAFIGGCIASICAMAGADQGERVAAKMGNKASRDYAAT